MPFSIPYLLVLTVFTSLAFSQWKCDSRMYGRPKVEDCASSMLDMPDAKLLHPTEKLGTFRKFVEPQFLRPAFRPVENDLAAPMEQLPRFWRYSQWNSKASVVAEEKLTHDMPRRILSYGADVYCQHRGYSLVSGERLDMGIHRKQRPYAIQEMHRHKTRWGDYTHRRSQTASSFCLK